MIYLFHVTPLSCLTLLALFQMQKRLHFLRPDYGFHSQDAAEGSRKLVYWKEKRGCWQTELALTPLVSSPLMDTLWNSNPNWAPKSPSSLDLGDTDRPLSAGSTCSDIVRCLWNETQIEIIGRRNFPWRLINDFWTSNHLQKYNHYHANDTWR